MWIWSPTYSKLGKKVNKNKQTKSVITLNEGNTESYVAVYLTIKILYCLNSYPDDTVGGWGVGGVCQGNKPRKHTSNFPDA